MCREIGVFIVTDVEEFGERPEEDMMRKLQLLSTAAVALLLTAGTAAAQDNPVQPQRAPAAQRHAPPEKIAPSMHAGEQKAPATTGQALEQSKAAEHSKAETTGQAPNLSESGKERMKRESKSNAKVNAENKPGASEKSSKSAESATSGKTENKHATTGQGAAAGAAKLSSQQRTKITTVIRQHRVPSAHLNISVRVGVRVPASVHYYPLPAAVFTIYPEWQGYDYIMVGDQILIVDPNSHLIVAILEA
jgi:Protein of unknown function (DUF1236)